MVIDSMMATPTNIRSVTHKAHQCMSGVGCVEPLHNHVQGDMDTRWCGVYAGV